MDVRKHNIQTNKLAVNVLQQVPMDNEAIYGRSVRLSYFDVHLATVRTRPTMENDLKDKKTEKFW